MRSSCRKNMICFRRNIYLALVVCLVAFASVLVYSYLCIQKYSLLPKIAIHKARGFCRRAVMNSSISVLNSNRSLVITAYSDNRVEKLTRVISIVHHEEVMEHYCWFCCPDSEEVYTSKAVIDVHSDRFGFPYATADLICLEPRSCDPPYVLLQSSPKEDISQLQQFEIKNRNPDMTPEEFTVCISTMFGNYNNVLQFIQSIEMYKLLGMKRAVIYKNSCSPLMEKVLKFYVTEGTVEIIPWPITSYLNVSTEWYFKVDGTQIGYYGQIAALNDCLYRNMYRSKYVVLNDIDEIILPLHHSNWKAMMESLEKQYPRASAFLFENHVFPNTVFTSSAVGIPSWKMVPGVNILQHVFREPDRKELDNPHKMIVNPRKIVQTSVHSVLQAFGGSVEVPMDTAMLHHCRFPFQPNLPRESLIKDTTIWRYNTSLINRVSRVLANIPL